MRLREARFCSARVALLEVAAVLQETLGLVEDNASQPYRSGVTPQT